MAYVLASPPASNAVIPLETSILPPATNANVSLAMGSDVQITLPSTLAMSEATFSLLDDSLSLSPLTATLLVSDMLLPASSAKAANSSLPDCSGFSPTSLAMVLYAPIVLLSSSAVKPANPSLLVASSPSFAAEIPLYEKVK
jgi:hypothetical protein